MGLMFAAFSDILPESLRAQSYGLFIAVFFGGYAIAPSLPLVLNHLQTAIASLILTFLSFAMALVWLPETLSDDVQQSARLKRSNERNNENGHSFCLLGIIKRPFDEITILAKDKILALLAAGSFFSSMVFASDSTLVLYYIEEQLDVGDKDIASMFLMLGIVGLILQGGAVQPLVQWLGEKRLLVVTFAFGSFHNILYGLARTKFTIYIALMVSQLTKLNTPVLSSLASKDADKEEQGRIQGALSASNAIAFSLGPLTMEFVYHRTKNTNLGPGFMWFYAAMLYAVGTCLIAFIPSDKNPDDPVVLLGDNTGDPEIPENDSLEQPLLQGSDE